MAKTKSKNDIKITSIKKNSVVVKKGAKTAKINRKPKQPKKKLEVVDEVKKEEIKETEIIKKPTKKKNVLEVWMNWDFNDAYYIERTEEINPKVLFGCKKLIYCLAYITLPYNFKGHGWNDAAFEHHIPNNCDIDDLMDVLSENDFMVYSDWGPCHSCEGLEITYYDENSIPFNITFNDIHKRWKKMSYDEICQEINDIEW